MARHPMKRKARTAIWCFLPSIQAAADIFSCLVNESIVQRLLLRVVGSARSSACEKLMPTWSQGPHRTCTGLEKLGVFVCCFEKFGPLPELASALTRTSRNLGS